MQGADGFERVGPDERDIAAEDEQVFRKAVRAEGEESFEHLERVTGAALLHLQNEVDAGGRDRLADALRLRADDGVDPIGRHKVLSGSNDMEEKGTSADLVKNFGTLRLEPCAFAGSHDGDREILEHEKPRLSKLTASGSFGEEHTVGEEMTMASAAWRALHDGGGIT